MNANKVNDTTFDFMYIGSKQNAQRISLKKRKSSDERNYKHKKKPAQNKFQIPEEEHTIDVKC